MGVVFGPSEDSPKHIMDDIKAAMIDSKMLLAASHSALNRNEFNQAETYAKLSDQHSGALTFPLWASDTPAKALKDIEAARKQSASAPAAGQSSQAPAEPATPGRCWKARRLAATAAGQRHQAGIAHDGSTGDR